MIIGIPKGLLYLNYHPFAETFFNELGAEIITSEDTNKNILNEGIKYCVDEACLPMKIFHGHVASLRGKCDTMLIPRIMCIRDNEFICPKFCGLPEMITNSIPNLPEITHLPIYINDTKKLYNYAMKIGKKVNNNSFKINRAFKKALICQSNHKLCINDYNYRIKVALIGHPYNIYDNFVNMNIHKKLNALGIGIVTEETVSDNDIAIEVSKLFKRPFWTFLRNSYGASMHLINSSSIDGLIYISSFGCGIDSVVTELIKDKIDDFPFMTLKIDEQTGEAGLNTRLEAFCDMLKRRKQNETNFSTLG